MVHSNEGLFINAQLGLGLLEVVLGLVEGLEAEGEGTPVHSD